VREAAMPREALYIADEVFFTGTAAEVTPVRSIDHRPVGEGRRGPITAELQDAFFDILHKGSDPYGWLHFIGKDADHNGIADAHSVHAGGGGVSVETA
ncbi:MAG: branched chain amino acid aminotransferase, partial [Bacteroidota bacterium]